MEFNWWIDTNPEIKKRVAKGKAEGALEEAGQMVLDAIQDRFPAQLPLAQRHVATATNPAQLRKLVLDVFKAPDEMTVMLLLTSSKSKPSTRRKNQ